MKRPLAKPSAVKLIAMNPTPPLTLTDLASDGLFLATAHDMCWKQLKEVQGIELNFSSAPAESGNDLPVDVRVYTAQGTVDFKGRRIAVLSDTTWRWATARKRDPAISQLHGEQPLSELLLAAARTLEGGNPILIGDQANGHKAAIAIDLAQAQSSTGSWSAPSPDAISVGKVLIEGIGDPFIEELDEIRAVVSFAQHRGLHVEEGDQGLRLTSANPADTTEITEITDITLEFLDEHISALTAGITPGANWRLEDISADGFYAAIEHAMFFSAHYPQAARENVLVNLETGHVLLDEKSGLEAAAVILATVYDGVFTWAWADSELTRLPSQGPVNVVRQFGIDKLVPSLVRRRMPAAMARELGLAQVAMPILNKWNVVTAKLNENTTAIVLIDSPKLRLPALAPHVEKAVLDNQPPAHINRDRAIQAYHAMRGNKPAGVPST